jgi:dipeptidyl aminopeptidase/acylaminoacyl peptidase
VRVLLLTAVLISAGPAAAAQSPASLDVSSLTLGSPTTVAELDLGKLKGDLRQLSWSPDGSQIAVRTSDGDKPTDAVHFYTIAVAGGAVTSVPREPEWATAYWAYKSDRSAPGLPAVMIDLDQKMEVQKVGTGSAGAAAGGDRTGGANVMSADNVDREAQNQREHVFRLTLYGEAVSTFVNERPLPGLQFGWGPRGSGAIAFVDSEGRLFLLDDKKHKRAIAGTKAALLPAWTEDGSRLAFVEKTGRKKYTLAWVAVVRP